MLGLFFGRRKPHLIGNGMAQQSLQRINAENIFMKTQTQSLARNRITSEIDNIAQHRDANMARQKQQRLEKEAIDRQTALATTSKKRKKSAL